MRRHPLFLRPVVVFLAFCLVAGAAFAEGPQTAPGSFPLAGEWLGALELGKAKLRIVFHVELKGEGLTATMDSPDQGAKGIPVASVDLSGSTVSFDVKRIGGRYQGKLDAGQGKIEGFWMQGGAKLPLVLVKQKQAALDAESGKLRQKTTEEAVRPQEPKPPFPYRTEEVAVSSQGGIRLAGTLCLPQGTGPFPAALLVTGSGQQDRDETVYGHRPFLVIADYLARRGIATLRLDDRGRGGSTGDFGASTTFDFAEDAAAALAFLRGRKEVDAAKLGVIGHSEGGLVAAILGAQDPGLAFVVLLAGPGLRGEELLYLQNAAIARASGVGEAAIAGANATNAALYAIALDGEDPAAQRAKIIEIYKAMAPAGSDPSVAAALEERGGSVADQLLSPWFECFLALDPAPYLGKLRAPLLALIGSKDLQVPAAENLGAIREAVAKSGNTDYTGLELDGLNHLFQTAQTGLPEEYGAIEETFSPLALKAMGDWLAERVK